LTRVLQGEGKRNVRERETTSCEVQGKGEPGVQPKSAKVDVGRDRQRYDMKTRADKETPTTVPQRLRKSEDVNGRSHKPPREKGSPIVLGMGGCPVSETTGKGRHNQNYRHLTERGKKKRGGVEKRKVNGKRKSI